MARQERSLWLDGVSPYLDWAFGIESGLQLRR